MSFLSHIACLGKIKSNLNTLPQEGFLLHVNLNWEHHFANAKQISLHSFDPSEVGLIHQVKCNWSPIALQIIYYKIDFKASLSIWNCTLWVCPLAISSASSFWSTRSCGYVAASTQFAQFTQAKVHRSQLSEVNPGNTIFFRFFLVRELFKF